MTRSKRLKAVVDVAEIKADKAGQALQVSRNQYSEKQQQLDQLLQFQQEYKERLNALGKKGVDAQQLQNYRSFLQQLGHAVNQQINSIADANEQLTEQKQAWAASYHRQKSLENIQREAVLQEQLSSEKGLQREADERASNNPVVDWR